MAKITSQQLFILAFAAALQLAFAQRIGPGSCPASRQPMMNFDLNRYVGHWYEYGRYPVPFNARYKCDYGNYVLDDNKVLVNGATTDASINHIYHFHGIANADNSGIISINYPLLSSILGPIKHMVLDTDYENYSVAYYCIESVLGFHTIYLYIMTRNLNTPSVYIQRAKNAIVQSGLDLDSFTLTSQDGCSEH